MILRNSIGWQESLLNIRLFFFTSIFQTQFDLVKLIIYEKYGGIPSALRYSLKTVQTKNNSDNMSCGYMSIRKNSRKH